MSEEYNKIVNWNELSVIMTGEAGVIRSNFVHKEHKPEVERLMKYITKWCEKNRKSSATIPRVTIKVNNTVTTIKQPKKVSNYKKLDKLPDGLEKISNGIYKKGECYYTNKFSMSSGLDVREWYKFEDAKEFLVSSLKTNI